MGPFLVAVLATFALLGVGTWGFVRAGERRHVRRIARLERTGSPKALPSAATDPDSPHLGPVEGAPLRSLAAATRRHLVTLEVLLEHARAMSLVESIVIDAQRRPLWVRLAAADLEVDVRVARDAANAWAVAWAEHSGEHRGELTGRLAERGLDLRLAIPPDVSLATLEELTARREWLCALVSILASLAVSDERLYR
jgi:hypothetical protein